MLNENKIKDKVGVSLQQQVQEERELQLLKTLYPHNGHILWEIDRKTLEVREADYTYEKTYKFKLDWKKGDKPQGEKTLIVKEGCEYVLALNKSNALKKFKENKDGTRYKTKGNFNFY